MPPLAHRALLPGAAWAKLRAWYGANGRHDLPWRRHSDPWRILVAETLLHRTRADIAAQLYTMMIDEFRGPRDVLRHADRWRELVLPGGLAWRADAFVSCCEQLEHTFNSAVPEGRAHLERLAGVGHYVAEAVRCFGYGIPSVLVDTNTIRLASRISGLHASPTQHRNRAVHELVGRLSDHAAPPPADDNYALLDLAALVCLPGTPRCEACPIAAWCRTGKSKVLASESAASTVSSGRPSSSGAERRAAAVHLSPLAREVRSPAKGR
jgi:A/G-specific adenine glycosylase